MRFLIALFITLLLITSEAAKESNFKSGSVDSEPDYSMLGGNNSPGIQGRVITKQGLPIEGAFISLECNQASCPPIPELGVITNRQGDFFWPIPPGNFLLTVHLNDKTSEKYPVIVKADKAVHIKLVWDN